MANILNKDKQIAVVSALAGRAMWKCFRSGDTPQQNAAMPGRTRARRAKGSLLFWNFHPSIRRKLLYAHQ